MNNCTKNMLDKILESCEYVSNNSKSVKINEIKLNEFARTIKKEEAKHWLMYSPYNILDLPIETIVNFLLVYEAIDFSFWGKPKWTIDTNNGKEDGGIALLYAMLKYVKDKQTTDFYNITKEEFKEILKGNVEIPLFEERYNIVWNVSDVVNKKMNGNFYMFIKDITVDTELFDVIVNNFPDFKDERTYNNKQIYYYKLAQLLTSDILHIRKLKENIQVDYSHLVGCSDYKIPQVMRGLGILEYSDKLSDVIDNQKEIEVNSEYEVEIRASMIKAIDLLKRKLKNEICAIDINDYIWSQGQNIKLKPYHLTRNTNY